MGKRIISHNLILKSQSNEILNLIKTSGLDPIDFIWQQTESSGSTDLFVSKLVHKSSNSFFKFDFLKGKHSCLYSPGEEKQKESNYPGDWKGQLNYFNNWLTYLKREIESPNLWETILEQNILKSDIDRIHSNDLFTIEEIKKIQSSVKEIKVYALTSFNLTESSKIFLENKLDYLVDSSKRLGRKDWIIILIGIITNIVIALSLSPSSAKDFFTIVSKAFDWLATYTVLLQ